MDGSAAVVVVALLAGCGYAAWAWALRRLRECEDRCARLEAQRREQQRIVALWPVEEADER